ncbi:MAG: response regulator [Desulfovibrio sp.]|nr:response regulator [Desulfovibrio sp.]MBI4959748.1 response regulator [Desulfovibrio sp.]
MESQAGILIVEDERIIALDLRSKVVKLGYTVLGLAHTGTEAVRLAGELQPDLVLMDIVLDGNLDGIEAARRIRNGCQVPVVFVSACNDPATKERAGQLGCSLFVSKPVDSHDLAERLREALSECRE